VRIAPSNSIGFQAATAWISGKKFETSKKFNEALDFTREQDNFVVTDRHQNCTDRKTGHFSFNYKSKLPVKDANLDQRLAEEKKFGEQLKEKFGMRVNCDIHDEKAIRDIKDENYY